MKIPLNRGMDRTARDVEGAIETVAMIVRAKARDAAADASMNDMTPDTPGSTTPKPGL